MKRSTAQLALLVLLLILFIYTAIEATSFAEKAKYFPLYISYVAITILVLEIIKHLINLKKVKKDDSELHPNLSGAVKYSIILFLYGGLVYVLGVLIATAIYVFLFLYYIAKMRLINTIITVTVLVVFLVVFADIMNLYWPKSWIDLGI